MTWAVAVDPYSGARHEDLLPGRYSFPATGRVILEYDWE